MRPAPMKPLSRSSGEPPSRPRTRRAYASRAVSRTSVMRLPPAPTPPLSARARSTRPSSARSRSRNRSSRGSDGGGGSDSPRAGVLRAATARRRRAVGEALPALFTLPDLARCAPALDGAGRSIEQRGGDLGQRGRLGRVANAQALRALAVEAHAVLDHEARAA